jgi:hypothetical protein
VKRGGPLRRGKPMKRAKAPNRNPPPPMPRAPLPPCGRGYATLMEAMTSRRGQAEGAEIWLCLNRRCGKWHVRLAGALRGGLAVRSDTGPDAKTRAAAYRRTAMRASAAARRSPGGPGRFDPGDHHARIDSRRDPSDEAKGLAA